MILVTYLSPWFLVDDLHDAILATVYAVYVLAEVPAILSCSTLCACASYTMCCMQGENKELWGKTPKILAQETAKPLPPNAHLIFGLPPPAVCLYLCRLSLWFELPDWSEKTIGPRLHAYKVAHV